MDKKKTINRNSYKYISSLIAQLLELDIDTEEKITGYIEHYGIDNFLKDYDKMEFRYEIYEKLDSLGLVLRTLNEQKVNFKGIGGAI